MMSQLSYIYVLKKLKTKGSTMPAAKDEFTQPELLYQTVENDILKKIVSGELPGAVRFPPKPSFASNTK